MRSLQRVLQIWMTLRIPSCWTKELREGTYPDSSILDGSGHQNDPQLALLAVLVGALMLPMRISHSQVYQNQLGIKDIRLV